MVWRVENMRVSPNRLPVVESALRVLRFHEISLPALGPQGWPVSKHQADIIAQLARGACAGRIRTSATRSSGSRSCWRGPCGCGVPEMPKGVTEPESLSLEQGQGRGLVDIRLGSHLGDGMKVILWVKFRFTDDTHRIGGAAATYRKHIEMPAPPVGLARIAATAGTTTVHADVKTVSWSEPSCAYVVEASCTTHEYWREYLEKDERWEEHRREFSGEEEDETRDAADG
jgi:hypothetical protein